MEATNRTDSSHRILNPGLLRAATGRCGPAGCGDTETATGPESVHDAEPGVGNYRRILVPVKLSSHSLVGIAVARKLACARGSRLVLLHVVNLNIAGEERGIDRTRLLRELQQAAEMELRQLAGNMEHRDNIDISVRVGNPAEVIPQAAGHCGADAIVMATHNSRGWLRRLGRDTIRTVTNRAPCAVWLAILDKQATV